jgi:tape measure domain-containing protein
LVLVYSAYQGLIASVKLSAELEQATAKFKVFTGSVREAEQTLAEIRELSRSSPVSFTGGQRAVTTMLQFGVASKDVTRSLRQIAEITGGDTQRMENLSLAFGQASAAGRLMGQELLQMVNAGFNPLKIISDQTGRSMKELKDAMSEGEISFQMVAQAFEDAVGPGGQFNGLLKEMSNTTAGQITRATNAVQELGIAFGDLLALGGSGSLIGEFTSSVNELAYSINTLRDVGKSLEGLGGGSDLRQFSFTGFELIGQTLDTGRLAIAGAQKDLFSFIEAYDRTVNRIGEDNLGLLISRDVIEGTEAIKAALKGIEAVRKKAIEDRTEAETIALNATSRRDRDARNVSQAEFQRLREKLKEDIKKSPTRLEDLELIVADADRTGLGFFSDNYIAQVQRFREEIEKANEALKEQTRIQTTFQEAVDDAKGDLLKNFFGDKAGNVELIRDQATGEERKAINKAIEDGEGYAKIVSLANAEAQAQLKALEAIQAKNKAYNDAKEKVKEETEAAKDLFTFFERAAKEKKKADEEAAKDLFTFFERAAKEKKKADEEAAKKQAAELKKLKEQADEIRKSKNPFADLIDKLSTAQLLNDKGLLSNADLAAEKNRLASENVKNVTATAAPVIGKGSQEAFQLITGQTVDKLTKQLQEVEKQTILATTAADVRQRTLEKLDELLDDKPATVGN